MSPSAGEIHQDISGQIFSLVKADLLKNKCDCKVYFELDLILSDNSVVRPDIMIIGHPRKGEYPTEAEIVVEILSKSTKLKDVNTKFKLYQLHAIPFYIIVDPIRKIVKTNKYINGKYQEIETTESMKLADCEIRIDWSKLEF